MATKSPPKTKKNETNGDIDEEVWSPPDICVGQMIRYLEPGNAKDHTKWCPAIVEHISPGEDVVIVVRAMPYKRQMFMYNGVRHIDDPKLKEQHFNAGNGRWDITDETKRTRARLDALEAQIERLL